MQVIQIVKTVVPLEVGTLGQFHGRGIGVADDNEKVLRELRGASISNIKAGGNFSVMRDPLPHRLRRQVAQKAHAMARRELRVFIGRVYTIGPKRILLVRCAIADR